MKSATIFETTKGYVIHSMSVTVQGVGVASPPFLCLDLQASPSMIGVNCAKALEESRENVRHPTDWQDFQRRYLSQLKTRSWSSFVRGTKSIHVSADSKGYQFIPMRNRGARQGFEHIPELAERRNSECSVEELGNSILTALNSSSAG
jgi:hypothetical protein